MAQRTFCDVCGKEINRWYKVTINCGGSNPNINVASLLKNTGTHDLCKDCFESAQNYLKRNKEEDTYYDAPAYRV